MLTIVTSVDASSTPNEPPESRNEASGYDDVIVWDDLTDGIPLSEEMMERLRSWVDKQVTEGHISIGTIRVPDDGSWP